MATLVKDKKSWMGIIEQLEKKQVDDPNKLDLIKKKIIAGQDIDLSSKKFLIKNYKIIIDSKKKSNSNKTESTNNNKKTQSSFGQSIIKKLKNFSRPQFMVTPTENFLQENTLQNLEYEVNSKKMITSQTYLGDKEITIKKINCKKHNRFYLMNMKKIQLVTLSLWAKQLEIS